MRILLLTWGALVLCAAPVGAQLVPDLKKEMAASQAQADLNRYHAMLAAYLRGDEANSVGALLFLSDERVDALLRLVNTDKDPFKPWDRRRRGLAVMLHTDLALRLSPDGDTRASMRQFTIVTNLLTMLARSDPDETRGFAEQWFYAMARYLRSRNSPYATDYLLSLGRVSVPDSAVILSESGTLAESMATDYALAGVQVHFSVSRGLSFPLGEVLRTRARHLDEAAAWLRQAALLDPNNDLLAAHLGRVLALQRQDTEAERVLAGVRDRTEDEATAYIAGLFIGGMRERAGDLVQAEAAYRAAIAAFPLGHAAYIGLSEVLQRTGQADASQDVLDRLLAETAGPTREPLWWYQFDPPGVADGRLAALRAQVRQ